MEVDRMSRGRLVGTYALFGGGRASWLHQIVLAVLRLQAYLGARVAKQGG